MVVVFFSFLFSAKTGYFGLPDWEWDGQVRLSKSELQRLTKTCLGRMNTVLHSTWGVRDEEEEEEEV